MSYSLPPGRVQFIGCTTLVSKAELQQTGDWCVQKVRRSLVDEYFDHVVRHVMKPVYRDYCDAFEYRLKVATLSEEELRDLLVEAYQAGLSDGRRWLS